MLLQRLFENLDLHLRPFATCSVSNDWRLRFDGIDAVTLHFVLSGEGALGGPGGTAGLRRHSLAIVPAHVSHSLSSGDRPAHEARARPARTADDLPRIAAGPADDDRLLIACGRLEAVYAGGLGLFDLLREPIVLDFDDSIEMRHTFERLLEEQRRNDPTSEAMMHALMTECLVMVFRRLCDAPDCPLPWLNALEDPRMAPALDAMLMHPDRAHSLASLAASARLSRSMFAERFSAAFGRTPMAFLRDVRLRRAAALLRETDLPVDAIARRVGFSSRSHFSRAFTERFELTPSAFRSPR